MADDEPGTRERILQAALEEFAMKGIAGARVDQIARRAGANVRMIYHYFENKRGLFRAVNAYALRNDRAIYDPPHVPEPGEDLFAALFGEGRPDPNWVRVLGWEELESRTSGEPVVNEEERTEQITRRVALIREAQAGGVVPAELDPRLLYLVLHAMSRSPYVFPALARTVTGMDPDSDAFAQDYGVFLAQLGRLLTRGPSAS